MPTLSSITPITPRQMRLAMRERFLAGRKAETAYARQLRQVAQQIGHIVKGIAPDGELKNVNPLMEALMRYGDVLRPWAESVASRMLADVARRDEAAWSKHGQAIGQALRKEIENAPTGAVMQQALREQVHLITSLPVEAAQRVHKLSIEAMVSGARAREIAAEIMRSGEVSKSRAMMLARTGVSTATTQLTKARAEHVGSTSYAWRTSRDGDVRSSHKAMEGKVVLWSAPPTIDGFTAHCGEFANCRCWPEVIIPER